MDAPGATKPILVLGIGNLLMADEGVGVHVAQHLLQRRLPPGVEVLDGGTGGFELSGQLRGRSRVVVVDAVRWEAPPGTIVRFTARDVAAERPRRWSAHQQGLADIVTAPHVQLDPEDIVIIGVVPQDVSTLAVGLTDVLRERVPAIAEVVLKEATTPR